ncbi:MAG: hypothetical protein Fur005_06090 [Roseiflexaceae bacterium]
MSIHTERHHWLWLGAVLLVVLAIGLWNLEGTRPWWDEGWTLSVARNIVERGMYVRLLNGEPVAHGLEASIPVTELVALSMRLFGVGLWQGRLPGVILAVVGLGLSVVIAKRMYGWPVGWATLFALLLLIPSPVIHPLHQGREVMAETPMYVSLLLGYLLTDLAARRSLWLLPVVVLAWAGALSVKAQPLPFWVVSLLCGIGAAAMLRQWRYVLVLLVGLIGGVTLRTPLYALITMWAAPPFSAIPVEGLLEVTAFVPDLQTRQWVLERWLSFGLLSTAGMAYAGYRLWQLLRSSEARDSSVATPLILAVCMFGLTATWAIWFLLLAVGMVRYMAPPIYFASPFVALLLANLTNQFDLAAVRQALRIPYAQAQRRVFWLLQRVVFVLVAAFVPLTLGVVTYFIAIDQNRTAQQTVAFLHAQPDDPIIETYETELHFLLDRRYHWPPDQAHVELNRRMFLGDDVAIPYDPLIADPDFLVVGGFARTTFLYDDLIATGAFRLVQEYGEYAIYERVRS